MRIVSLSPSATEICFALGAGSDVVGVTFECDYPPEARTRPIVSSTALPEGLDPAGIDAAVRDLIAAGTDLYHLDRDALARLDPDVVITQDLCAVCALDSGDVTEALAYLGCTAEVVTTDPRDLAGVWASVELIGKALGRTSQASYLLEGLRERVSSVKSSRYGVPPVRVMLLEWTDPPYAPGHWIPEMVSVAGGINVLGSIGARSFPTTWAEVAAAAPDRSTRFMPAGFVNAGRGR
ncbi:ABC transporter substrate-binding protein [Kribbella sp. NBC_01245]|uniref:ABC transporter substrate-binding protein n=1 Tax=Kribbella sp. NBC_01245 TaxID=2903578 RepID=UPI002E2BCFB1|nr:ABC transporter substrate-binding protein [Kribbella sp. NBC_01245]